MMKGSPPMGARILRNAGHGANDIYWFVLPSLLPVILEQFNMKYVTAGGMLTAFLGVIALFSFVLGKISDHLPRATVLGAGFLCASLFLIVASFMNGLDTFVLFILFAGVGVSSYHPAIYASIDETTSSRRGRVYGGFEFWGSASVFFMFILHGLLLKSLAWKTIILLTSIPGLAIGALYLRCARHASSPSAAPAPSAAHRPEQAHTPLIFFVLFLVVVTFRFFGIMGVVNFTTTYLVREVGVNASIASFATGIYFLGGLAFTPIAGNLCDRKGPFPVLLVLTLMGFPLIFVISLVRQMWFLPIPMLLLGASYYGAGPAMSMITARMGSRMGKGEAFGYFMAIIAVTYSFSPLLFGMYADQAGLRAAIRLFSFPLLAAALGLFSLYRMLGADRKGYAGWEATAAVRMATRETP